MTTAITKVETATITNIEYFSDAVIEEFVASRHGSANSCKTYRNATRRLLKYFAVEGITQPTVADFDAYINSLKSAGKSAATLRLYNTVAKMFFSFTSQRGLYPDVAKDATPLKLRKAQHHNKKALSTAQAQKLMAAVKGDDIVALRDRAIIALALQCGLRTVELERANVEDLKDAGDYYTLDVQGKGRTSKDETVKVALPVANLILQYLAARGNVANDAPLFVSTSHNRTKYGERLSAQSVGKLIKRYMKSVGIDDKKITPHSCRHFAATTAIKAGVDIREVSAMLRHSSLNVTMCYLHDISLETRRAELAVADTLFSGIA